MEHAINSFQTNEYAPIWAVLALSFSIGCFILLSGMKGERGVSRKALVDRQVCAAAATAIGRLWVSGTITERECDERVSAIAKTLGVREYIITPTQEELKEMLKQRQADRLIALEERAKAKGAELRAKLIKR